jgi:hypothetical protein
MFLCGILLLIYTIFRKGFLGLARKKLWEYPTESIVCDIIFCIAHVKSPCGVVLLPECRDFFSPHSHDLPILLPLCELASSLFLLPARYLSKLHYEMGR